ncbi:MAG: RdgB/HAM1 family non-canonical purine NTP pyrophosphatase [Deltaproteobacteria bacterium]|nr:RdgB/HAM1 family non-canonical purine NTP pyrophosphatase [Deltaproteobacteria bacterium]MBI3294767.1 RdgB/HAM1 family non-canonical purine NTP pyrophosphatase [Deltaproteobacteria bacterium]
MARPILLATQNRGKVAEFQAMLVPFDVVTPPASILIEETGATYCENALIKALRHFEKYRVPVLADDSGLECDALKGEPGVFSARFGGERISWPDRWKLLNDTIARSRDPKNHRARFRAVLCYYDGTSVPQFFEGVVEGEILASPRGDKGFGYDPIFLVPERGLSMAEIDSVEKNRISHRAKAAQAFLRAYPKTLP